MKSRKVLHVSIGGWVWLATVILWTGLGSATAALEQSFDVLQVGTQVYSNVTVTTKSKTYVFILHSTGMTNIRVADLPQDVQQKLGYAAAEDQISQMKPGAWAKKTIAKLESPQVKGVGSELIRAWREGITSTNLQLHESTPESLALVGCGLLALYLFFCYCCLLICQKTAGRPGILVLIPILQAIPLFGAAGMSGWWLVALFIPGLNLLASIMWCVKIVQARRKSGWLTLFLLLPPTSLLAFLYLAFSDAAPARKVTPRVQIMTLETA